MKTNTFTCELCGEEGKDISTSEVVLPWGETCQECVKAIKKEKAINAIKVSIDSTNEEEGELIAHLMRAIQLLEEAN